MPIYAYRCSACGHAKDLLQKMSDPVLTVCPACGASSFAKQLTAAGFQLKGSGWYVTDFRGGNTAAPKAADGADEGKPGADKPAAADKPAETPAATAGKAADRAAAAPAPAPAAASAPVSAPAPAASSPRTGS
jgi:putative FmdB family regulatory protein